LWIAGCGPSAEKQEAQRQILLKQKQEKEEQQRQQAERRLQQQIQVRMTAVENAAKEAIKRPLRDPDSALFKIHAVKLAVTIDGLLQRDKSKPATIEEVVCGEVNARNGYGGYVGYKPFIWLSQSFSPLNMANMDEDVGGEAMRYLTQHFYWEYYCGIENSSPH